MRIHRTAHTRYFTNVGNEALRDSRLSFCARGLLAHLLSLPDGQREDIRSLADRTPEGRERVASAMRELEKFGYLRRPKRHTPEGKLYTEIEVFDTPGAAYTQVPTDAGIPGSGAAHSVPDGGKPVKEREKEPTPGPSADEDGAAADAAGSAGRAGAADAPDQQDVALLARVARAEPKLSLGRREALRLAPLVAEWRRRGASDLHIINSLTAGLPRCGVHHPSRFIETRLQRKMPAERTCAPPRPECDECRDPIQSPGLCARCANTWRPPTQAAGEFVDACSRGAALARAALRGALARGGAAPAPA
jgi:hypothetical protein